MTTNTFTKTEALRRLRATAADARRRCRLPKSAKCEIGLRIHPVATSNPEALDSYVEPHDDLDTHVTFDEVNDYRQTVEHGAIVHLYLFERYDRYEWELRDVCVVWLGLPNVPARVLDVNGKRVEVDTAPAAGDGGPTTTAKGTPMPSSTTSPTRKLAYERAVDLDRVMPWAGAERHDAADAYENDGVGSESWFVRYLHAITSAARCVRHPDTGEQAWAHAERITLSPVERLVSAGLAAGATVTVSTVTR